MVEAKLWILKNKVEGTPKLEDFECKTEVLEPCKDGEILIEAEWLSVDPYIRYRLSTTQPGETITGSQVSRVIESRNDSCPVGTYVVSYPGWRSHSKMTREEMKNPFQFQKLPDMGPIRKSAALGVLGMPGNTAYFGLLEICKPKPGETVLVNGAAGAVGSAVVQIAKLKGCRVIAFAGSDAKVDYIKGLGIDLVYNYKTQDVGTVLKTAAPDGVNCYFDNVGGDFTAAVFPHLAQYARVSLCGAISIYNTRKEGAPAWGPFDNGLMIFKQIRIEGFVVYRWTDRWMEGINQMAAWIKEGKIKYTETVTEGFDNTPAAFIGLFSGENLGKAVIKC